MSDHSCLALLEVFGLFLAFLRGIFGDFGSVALITRLTIRDEELVE